LKLIFILGNGNTGKSTLSYYLSQKLPNSKFISTDDFFVKINWEHHSIISILGILAEKYNNDIGLATIKHPEVIGDILESTLIDIINNNTKDFLIIEGFSLISIGSKYWNNITFYDIPKKSNRFLIDNLKDIYPYIFVTDKVDNEYIIQYKNFIYKDDDRLSKMLEVINAKE